MPDEQPSWFQLLRDDIAGMRTDFNARLDKLVSNDAFLAEQKRRDELHASLGRDVIAEREARIAADADIRADLETATATAKQAQATTEARKVNFRQALTIALITAIAAGVVSMSILIIQNAAHLG